MPVVSNQIRAVTDPNLEWERGARESGLFDNLQSVIFANRKATKLEAVMPRDAYLVGGTSFLSVSDKCRRKVKRGRKATGQGFDKHYLIIMRHLFGRPLTALIEYLRRPENQMPKWEPPNDEQGNEEKSR